MPHSYGIEPNQTKPNQTDLIHIFIRLWQPNEWTNRKFCLKQNKKLALFTFNLSELKISVHARIHIISLFLSISFHFFSFFFGLACVCAFIFIFILFISPSLSLFFSTKVYIFIYFIFQTQHLLFMCFIYAFWFLIYPVCISWLLYVCSVYYWAWVDLCVCVCCVSCCALKTTDVNFQFQFVHTSCAVRHTHRASFPSLSALDVFFLSCPVSFVSFLFRFALTSKGWKWMMALVTMRYR